MVRKLRDVALWEKVQEAGSIFQRCREALFRRDLQEIKGELEKRRNGTVQSRGEIDVLSRRKGGTGRR